LDYVQATLNYVVNCHLLFINTIYGLNEVNFYSFLFYLEFRKYVYAVLEDTCMYYCMQEKKKKAYYGVTVDSIISLYDLQHCSTK
jgi:hypothetical protein